MSFQPSLFGSEPTFDRQALATKLQRLSDRNVFIGTSSWRYEGWLNQIYTPERYRTRSRFSKQKFHDECIQEYAETFPVVGADFSFYAIPERPFWKKIFDTAPPQLKWSLKVPEEFTAKHFSDQVRYGPRRGQANPAFLDAELFESAFLEPLAPYLDRIAVLIFEFGTFSEKAYAEPNIFFDDLNSFARRLPKGVRYAVEIRNDDYLRARYFDVLKANGIAHTFNSWSRMPSLREQILIDEAFTARHTVGRALLRPGRLYQQAVDMFAPYKEVKEEYPSARQALRGLIDHSLQTETMAFLHINNRLEGNAVLTIAGVLGTGP
jgi:uncharacterized protein YecE (DUF72 family)